MRRSVSEFPRARLLFVDDEQAVLDALEASLRRLRRVWDMKFACGGAAGLREMDAIEFDAVVTDMRMPEIDGEAILSAARDRHPKMIRVILSGQTDEFVVNRTILMAHEFLAKPCSPVDLRRKLERLFSVVMPMGAPLREALCSLADVPIGEPTVLRLLATSPDLWANPKSLVACIEHDAALSTKILHVANAGFYSSNRSVVSVEQAVACLGSETIRAIVRSMRTVDGPAAPLALRIADQSFLLGRSLKDVVGRERGVLCGSFHGLGTLALLSRFGEEYAAMLRSADTVDCARRNEVELERFGMTHDATGAGLAGLWGVAPEIVDAIAWHCHPTQSQKGGQLGVELRAACSRCESVAALDDRMYAGLDEAMRGEMLSRA